MVLVSTHTGGWIPDMRGIPWSCTLHEDGKTYGISNTCWCLERNLYDLGWIYYWGGGCPLLILLLTLNCAILFQWHLLNNFYIEWEAIIWGGLDVISLRVCFLFPLVNIMYKSLKSLVIGPKVRMHYAARTKSQLPIWIFTFSHRPPYFIVFPLASIFWKWAIW